MDDHKFIEMMSAIGVDYNGKKPLRNKFERRRMMRPLFKCKMLGFELFDGKRVEKCMERGTQLFLKMERLFDDDQAFITVYNYQYKIGYLPQSYNSAVARMLENGYRLMGIVRHFDNTEEKAVIKLEIVSGM